MKYYSLSNPTIKTSFENAVVNGIAPDRGLYFPEEIPSLSTSYFEELPQLSILEMAYTAMAPFVGDEIPQAVLENILKNTLDFDFPVVPIKDNMGIWHSV